MKGKSMYFEVFDEANEQVVFTCDTLREAMDYMDAQASPENLVITEKDPTLDD